MSRANEENPFLDEFELHFGETMPNKAQQHSLLLLISTEEECHFLRRSNDHA